MKVVRPIFIIGAPRSGTSITTWVLGQHPNIQPMPETAWIASLAVGAYLSHAKGCARGRYSHLSNVDFPLAPFMARIGESVDDIVQDVFADRCLQHYGEESLNPDWRLSADQSTNPLHIRRAASDPKHRWIDGTPLNSFYIAALAQLFPHAQFIHNLRPPADVATSLEGFAKVGAEPQTLEQGLDTWMAHTENAWYAERALGRERAFRLDFDRIAREPDILFREVCDFLGESYTSDCLLPLQQKVNSSDVENRRESNLALLRENPAFQHAEAVYASIKQQPAGEHPDAFSLEVLRQRLADYCRDRSIV